MIEVQNLTKRYPTQLAVSDVSFSVRRGRDRRLPRAERRREDDDDAGPDGVPSAHARDRARRGSRRRRASRREARASLGYLPESAALYPEMRVREYLAFRARLEGVSGPERQAAGRARRSRRCLLEEVADRKVENLSKGFRQRTALAGALVHQPPVLILDEPTVGLDPVQIIKIRETIRRLGRERAVLLSTHILPEVDAVCDRVLIIDRGRIVAEGTPEELRAGSSRERPRARRPSAAPRGAREALGEPPGRDRRSTRGDDAARRASGSTAQPTPIRERTSSARPWRTGGSCASCRASRFPRGRLRPADAARRTGAARVPKRTPPPAPEGEPVVKKLLAIVGREWRAYFFSPLAYVILAAFLLLNGIIFSAILALPFDAGRPEGAGAAVLFTNTYFWIFNLFVVPIIAMRLFPEERKSGTIESC